MPNSTFMQTSFLGGFWSPSAQGRMDLPIYKTALNECLNYVILEEGAMTRRPGFKKLGITRGGQTAKLLDFDFTSTQPYQMEFTNLKLRLWANDVLVKTNDGPMTVSAISADNPAKVFLTTAVPAGWSNGDTVIFNLNGEPCSAPLMCGQQYVIANKSGSTFTLKDAVTNADIDGADLAYQVPDTTLDTVEKIYEITTPYAAADIEAVKRVQNLDSVLLLHPDYAPRVLSGDAPYFTLATATFIDGPYLDINATTTTLTLSARTGSVTVTASSATGINDDTGFQTTDIGRLIRFQAGPAEWDSGTTYDKYQRVTGSDGNVYWSLIHTNLNHDPTTDSGANWALSKIEVTWTWLLITARASTTSVTATIMGDDIPPVDVLTTDQWQLGLYSDTTSWPANGTYHEGRIWLAGAVKNRVDAGTANNLDPATGKAAAAGSFYFTPTDTDGTVSDGNGITATPNAAEADVILWMVPDSQGLIVGTQSGEWAIRASSLDDPISPTSIQMRRVTTIGCADVEPAIAWANLCFVQRQQRKIVEHGASPYGGTNKYDSANLSHLVDSLLTTGVAEIKWQQEPLLTVWTRGLHGILRGFFYQKSEFTPLAQDSQSVVAWHRHSHGQDRRFESLSTGPSADGLSTSLYAVTNNADSDASDYNIRNVEILMPVFDSGADDCDAFFVDNGIVPCCAQKFLVSNGDSFDGVRLWGFTQLEDQSVAAFIGGLDVGDFAVSGGHIDVPFDTTFTEAFFDAIGTCATLGSTANYRTVTTETPTYSDALIAYVGDEATVDYNSTTGGNLLVDHDNGYVVLHEAGTSGTDGAYCFNDNTDATVAENTETDIFGAGPAHTWDSTSGRTIANDYFYCNVDGGNSAPIAKIRTSDLTAVSVWGASDASLAQSDTSRIVASFSMAGGKAGSVRYLMSCGIRSGTAINEVAVLAADTGGSDVPLLYAQDIAENLAQCCVGLERSAVNFFVTGSDKYGSASANPHVFYEYVVTSGGTVTKRTIGSVDPTDIDATWTNFSNAYAPGCDLADGNILAFFITTDAVTNKYYFAKIDRLSGAVLWVSAVTGNPSLDLAKSKFNGTLEFFDDSVNKIVRIDLSDGSQTLTAWNAGLAAQGSQIYSHHTGSIGKSGAITLCCSYTESGTPVPTYLGSYLPAHSNQIPSKRHGRIFTGAPWPDHTDTPIPFFACVGFTYSSRGQLLRPDFGQDAGTRLGPAFAKKRRASRTAALLSRTQGIKFGTDFDHLNAAPITRTGEGWTAATAPATFSGTVKMEINDDFGYESKVCWEQTRPYPGTVLAISVDIESQA